MKIFFEKLYKKRFVQSLIDVYKTKHFRFYIYALDALDGNTESGNQENEKLKV